eukprot:sb/3472675/
MANNSNTSVQFVYKRVIEETIKSSRETFLNEGIEDSVLQELKMLWERKVQASSALEPSNPPDYMPHHRHMHMGQPQNHGFVMGRPPQTLLARQPIAARPANIGEFVDSDESEDEDDDDDGTDEDVDVGGDGDGITGIDVPILNVYHCAGKRKGGPISNIHDM